MCIDDCFIPILICSIGVVLLGSLIATIVANIIEYLISKNKVEKEIQNMTVGSLINERTATIFIRLMNQYNSSTINQEQLIESLQKLRDEHIENINESRRMGLVDI